MVAVVFAGAFLRTLLFGRGPIPLGRAGTAGLSRYFEFASRYAAPALLVFALLVPVIFYHQPLHPRSRRPRPHLCHARLGPEHRGRPRRPAGSRLRRLLRGRRLFLRPALDATRPVVLDLPAARGLPCRVLGNHPRLSGAAAARRLSCHRHARVRRDHPARHHQLVEPHRRAERHPLDPPPLVLRAAVRRRRGFVRRDLRPRVFGDASRRLPVLSDPGARAP